MDITFSFCSVCGKLRKKISNGKRRREREKKGGTKTHKLWQMRESKRERERLCMYLELQLFIDGALGRTNPTQTIPNWQRITQNRSPLTRTYIHTPCKYTHTKPSIRSKTNILTLTRVQFLRVGFWEMKKTTKYSGIPSRGPPALSKAFYLKQFQQ